MRHRWGLWAMDLSMGNVPFLFGLKFLIHRCSNSLVNTIYCFTLCYNIECWTSVLSQDWCRVMPKVVGNWWNLVLIISWLVSPTTWRTDESWSWRLDLDFYLSITDWCPFMRETSKEIEKKLLSCIQAILVWVGYSNFGCSFLTTGSAAGWLRPHRTLAWLQR